MGNLAMARLSSMTLRLGMTRKRNNKCRNNICACTGACFVNDGTGDFAPKNALGFPIPQNLVDFMVGDILEMSDEEIIQEAIEELGSKEAVDAEVERMRTIVQKAINKAKQNRINTRGVIWELKL